MLNRFKKVLSVLCIISLLVTGTMIAFAEEPETPATEETSITVEEISAEEAAAQAQAEAEAAAQAQAEAEAAAQAQAEAEAAAQAQAEAEAAAQAQAEAEAPAQEPETDPSTIEETPAEETPAADTPSEETPAADTPSEETPAADTPAEETPAADTSSEETPAADTPSEETPAADTPAEETPAADTPSEETPAADTPAEETPAADTPSEETPAQDTPAEETPAPETPAEETYAEETPAPQTPSEGTPAPETPAPETPAEKADGDDFGYTGEEEIVEFPEGDMGRVDPEVTKELIPEITPEMKFPEIQQLTVNGSVSGTVVAGAETALYIKNGSTMTIVLGLYTSEEDISVKINDQNAVFTAQENPDGDDDFYSTYELDVVADEEYTIILTSNQGVSYKMKASIPEKKEEEATVQEETKVTEEEPAKTEEEEPVIVNTWITVSAEEYAIGDTITLTANADIDLENLVTWQTKVSSEDEWKKAGYGENLTVELTEENANSAFRFKMIDGNFSNELQIHAGAKAEEVLEEIAGEEKEEQSFADESSSGEAEDHPEGESDDEESTEAPEAVDEGESAESVETISEAADAEETEEVLPDNETMLSLGYKFVQVSKIDGADLYGNAYDNDVVGHAELGKELWVMETEEPEWALLYSEDLNEIRYIKWDDVVIILQNEEDEEILNRMVIVKNSIDDGGFVAFGTAASVQAELINFSEDDIIQIQWFNSVDGGKTWNIVNGANELLYAYEVTFDNWYYTWKAVISIG